MESQRPTIQNRESLLSGAFPRLTYTYRRSANERLWGLIDRVRSLCERKSVRRTLAVFAALFCFSSGALAFVAFWPRPVPDVALDSFDDVLDYTLLSDDFNKLPLEKRLEIIKQLISRLKGMDAGDSALMSSFAAGIMGKAREQLRKNAEKMAVDLWDAFATGYDGIKGGDREAYLDDAFIQFSELMEDVSGFKSDMKPEDRLAEGRKQANRDMQRMKEDSAKPMEANRAAGFMKQIHERGDQLAKPEQRARMAKFSRDMTRRLRNQDINTGKPKDGPPEPLPKAPAKKAAKPGQSPGKTPPNPEPAEDPAETPEGK